MRHGERVTQRGVDARLILSAYCGRDPESEERAHVYCHLARLALAVTAAHSALPSGPRTIRTP